MGSNSSLSFMPTSTGCSDVLAWSMFWLNRCFVRLIRPKKKNCLFPVGRPTYLLTPEPNFFWAKYFYFLDRELRFEKKLSVLARILTEIGYFENIHQKTNINLET